MTAGAQEPAQTAGSLARRVDCFKV